MPVTKIAGDQIMEHTVTDEELAINLAVHGSRIVIGTITSDKLIPTGIEAGTYSIVTVDTWGRITSGSLVKDTIPMVTTIEDGLMSSVDKQKLDSVGWGASLSEDVLGASNGIATLDNNGKLSQSQIPSIDWANLINVPPSAYLPNHTHVATEITQDIEHRFVTNTQITEWNGKANAIHVHNSNDIITNATYRFVSDSQINSWTNKANSTHNHVATDITQDSNNRFVTDTQISEWNNKANSTHNHVATDIAQDSNNKFVTDIQISEWNNKANLVHNHVATDITQDSNNRFVTDTQISAWNSKQNALGFIPQNIVNKNAANGYAGLDSSGKIFTSQLPSITITDTFVVENEVSMLSLIAEVGDVAVRTDLSKSFILKETSPDVLTSWQELLSPSGNMISVNGKTGVVVLIPTDIGAANEVHSHLSEEIIEDVNHNFVTETQISTWNAKANEIHTHVASSIEQNSENRMVTDTQISTWNAKQGALGFTPENIANKNTINGYAGLDNSGLIYLNQIPLLSATKINQDLNNRFVTDLQISEWNNKAELVHTHNPDEIITNTNNRFVTDLQISEWNNKGDMNKSVYDPSNSGKVEASVTADVANSVDWAKINNIPSSFVPAVHVHSGSDITSGTISSSVLPIASVTNLGLVKIGSGIAIDGEGTITVTASGSGDMLRSAYDTANSGNAVDNARSVPWSGITGKPSTFPSIIHTHDASEIISGTLSSERLPVASKTKLGAVQLNGTGIFIDNSNNVHASIGRFERYMVDSNLDNETWITSRDPMEKFALSWIREGIVLTITSPLHGLVSGDRVIIRNANIVDMQTNNITVINENSFTIVVADTGETIGNVCSYQRGFNINKSGSNYTLQGYSDVYLTGGSIKIPQSVANPVTFNYSAIGLNTSSANYYPPMVQVWRLDTGAFYSSFSETLVSGYFDRVTMGLPTANRLCRFSFV